MPGKGSPRTEMRLFESALRGLGTEYRRGNNAVKNYFSNFSQKFLYFSHFFVLQCSTFLERQHMTKITSIRVHEELYTMLKELADIRKQPISSLINQMIRDGLASDPYIRAKWSSKDAN